MIEQQTAIPWTRPGWFAEASTWLQATLDHQGLQLLGEIEQPHIRPWSTVLRVPTDAGTIYFKAASPVLGHEPALTAALARWRPDCMIQVLATDLERGWFLMADGGVPMRSLIHSAADLDHWQHVLPLYAQVQLELAPRQQELLALGILDRRLAHLPTLYEQLLTDTDALLLDHPDGLTSAQYQQLQALAPRFAAMCQTLAAYGLPETLHHDDFHDANIFVRDGIHRFSDWAESCLAHPFFTLMVTFRGIAHRQHLAAGGPELTALRDLYLTPWALYGTLQELIAAFTLAQRIAMVCRTLTWYRVVSSLEGANRAEHADAVPGWLLEFLQSETDQPIP
jgi:hypothetical protein